MSENVPYFGVRGIGARRSVRTLEKLRELTDAVIRLTKPGMYRKSAVSAVQNAGMRVYLPASMWEEEIDDFFENLMDLVSQGNTDGEPVYSSLREGNLGKNDDGSEHNGFLVIDVIERLVVDLVNMDGTTRLRTALVQFATAEQVILHSPVSFFRSVNGSMSTR